MSAEYWLTATQGSCLRVGLVQTLWRGGGDQKLGAPYAEGVSHDSWLVTIGTLEPRRQGVLAHPIFFAGQL